MFSQFAPLSGDFAKNETSLADEITHELLGRSCESEDAESILESFPVDVFPDSLADYCKEVAAATGTPTDFAGVAMLVVAGAAIGNSRALRIKSTWLESPRMYAAIIGDPASGKTPAVQTVVKPYREIQADALNKYERAQSQIEQDIAVIHSPVNLDDANQENPEQARVAPRESSRPERLVVGEATVESLAPILASNPRGLLMIHDEGSSWVRGMGQYKGGRGNDKQFWLSCFSGQDYTVDRKSQGVVPISIRSPFINVVCNLPPDMLNELADSHGRKDGFLDRLLFTFPEAVVASEWNDEEVSRASLNAWSGSLRGLRDLAMERLEGSVQGPKIVNLSSEAKARWASWWNKHVSEMGSTDLPSGLSGHWGKLGAHAGRLALLLHFVWLTQTNQDEHDLQPESVDRAVLLINYFKNHLKKVYGRLRLSVADVKLESVLAWIQRKGGACTARELTRSGQATPTAKANQMLRELVDRGYGQFVTMRASNNKPTTEFHLEPKQPNVSAQRRVATRRCQISQSITEPTLMSSTAAMSSVE
jgi:hypothetical protein